MPRFVRSARGDLIDFELMAIKAQLAAAPAPKTVDQRKAAIDAKDGVKTDVLADLDMFAIATEGVAASAAAGKQIKKK